MIVIRRAWRTSGTRRTCNTPRLSAPLGMRMGTDTTDPRRGRQRNDYIHTPSEWSRCMLRRWPSIAVWASGIHTLPNHLSLACIRLYARRERLALLASFAGHLQPVQEAEPYCHRANYNG